MQNMGTIVLVEDDDDDIELIKTIIQESFSHHELKVFISLASLFEWLNLPHEKPFLIICDNNWRNRNQEKLTRLAGLNPGFHLAKIPFIFFSATLKHEDITKAFEELNVQGYFDKGENYFDMKNNLSAIINYWERSSVPTT